MNDPLNDPRFPDRPQHPDFWRLSEVIVRIDGAATEGGESVEDLMGVDLESFMYFAQHRVRRARDLARHPSRPFGAESLEVLLMTLYMDAFALGKGFAEAQQQQPPPHEE